VCSARGSEADSSHRAAIVSPWLLPAAGLIALWIWLAFSSGGYAPANWLPASLALGLFALVASLAGAFPRLPGQLSLALLAIMAVYTFWVGLSALWAASTTRVWLETGRTLSYLLLFALALIYFTDVAARRSLRYLIMAAALGIAVTCIAKLWVSEDISPMFISDRFSYPLTATNQAGTLLLITFWPLVWLASSSNERSPVRGLALGVATALLGLAVMTQSRGAVWSLGLSGLLMFIIAPTRLRLLLYLIVPALLMVYEFPTLNRYWTEGAEAVSGSAAARTLLVAAIIAGFAGMIVALLERWVRVSLRMKAVFGAVVIAGAIAGLTFWAVTATSDVGGPTKWASQVWRQFASDEPSQTPAEPSSRFSLVSSTGRVQIWKIAIEEFKSSPLLGVGADNFVFEHDRLRTSADRQSQQAHSIELQVFGETGIVGGVIFSGGVLLALGGWLWPRCAAGWREARNTWLRRKDGKGPSARWCNPRWGNDSRAYGWDMALLAGAAYWLIHASVDWIWQMPGVTIPAFLFVAAAIAGIDARAGVMWPRLRRWLRVGAADSPQPTEEDVPAIRRMDRDRVHALLAPVFRALMVAASAAVLLLAGLPYLSLLFQNSALALSDSDGLRAVERAAMARHLVPDDPGPYLTQASIYDRAATQALEQEGWSAAGAILDNLALAAASYADAASVEPADWTTHFHRALMLLNFVTAKSYIEGWQTEAGQQSAELLGLRDWSALEGAAFLADKPAPVGLAPGSLAQDGSTRARAEQLRNLSASSLKEITMESLRAAKERNPLATQIEAALKALDTLKLPAS